MKNHYLPQKKTQYKRGNTLILLLLFAFLSCKNDPNPAQKIPIKTVSETVEGTTISLNKVSDIAPPTGFKRDKTTDFGLFLREIKLKKDKTVYLFDGHLKGNQTAQFAVLDVSVGDRDLQQCADAVMRMRAEFLYAQKQFDLIRFKDGDGFSMDFGKWIKGNRIVFSQNKLSWQTCETCNASRESFTKYLNTVFAFAGTATLAKELKPINNLKDIEIGDVFIKGGSPGHAIIVMDVAVNAEGKKVFLLAQSYMPAQDIHILRNPSNAQLSPWYSTDFGDVLETPEWDFTKEQLKRF
jgi:Domain of unknown function (4846)